MAYRTQLISISKRGFGYLGHRLFLGYGCDGQAAYRMVPTMFRPQRLFSNSSCQDALTMEDEMLPQDLVAGLDEHIIGQQDAKRSLAVVLRDRWCRQQIKDPELRSETTPSNILLIGPSGCGKTELARRIAQITKAPFVKVVATKFTEVGFVGDDTHSMVNDLAEQAYRDEKSRCKEKVRPKARHMAENHIITILLETPEFQSMSSAVILDRLRSGLLNDVRVEIDCSLLYVHPSTYAQFTRLDWFDSCCKNAQRLWDGSSQSLHVALKESHESFSFITLQFISTYLSYRASSSDKSGNNPFQQILNSLNGNVTGQPSCGTTQPGLFSGFPIHLVLSKLPPLSQSSSFFKKMDLSDVDEKPDNDSEKPIQKEISIKNALPLLEEHFIHDMIDEEQIIASAKNNAENRGIIFIDEFDKLLDSKEGNEFRSKSRGVQKELLSLMDGTSVNTSRLGRISTEFILFVASGAFHMSKPADIMPELQGRLPIRSELQPLTIDDFKRILLETKYSLLKQQIALLETEGISLSFTPEAISAIAQMTYELNTVSANIGARRLRTVFSQVLEDVKFNVKEYKGKEVTVDRDMVLSRLVAPKKFSLFLLFYIIIVEKLTD